MGYKPYLSLDIETTNLTPDKGFILEIGMIWDDLVTPLEDLKTKRIVIRNPEPIFGGYIALQMNADLMIECNKEGVPPHVAAAEFKSFLDEVSPDKRITVAGKNAAGFDIPWLKMHGFKIDRFKHRILDPGSMYFEEFGYIPNLTEINNHINNGTVTHNAVEDAMDVVVAIRTKLGVVLNED